MSDIKYQYNPKTFRYERSRITFKDALWYVSGLFVTAMIFSGIAIGIHDYWIETENERALVIENNLLKKHKPVLEEDLTNVEATLVNLKEVDKELYLRIFNSEAPEYTPLATSISREQALLADASGFRDLLSILKTK
ncbi:MAG TPA: hypothetical protein VK589_02240, partial [Chryseolinea sp.]|nr:hypothetical protein [Chryseolinea sp.]